MEIFTLLISSSLFLFFLYKSFKSQRLVLFLPIFYNFIVIYTLIGTYFFTFAVESPFNLYYEISNEYINKAFHCFILSSVAFYMGTTFHKKNKQAHVYRIVTEIKRQKTLIFTILGVYVAYIIGYGLEPLIHRSEYIDAATERNKIIMILFFMISPFVTTLIPFIRSVYIKYLVYIFCFLILFSSSSRFVVIVPFLFVIGTFLKDKKFSLSTVFVNLSLIIFSFIFILQIRYYPYHGLIPNIQSLFSKGLDIQYLYLGINYAFSFSVFGVAYVLKTFTLDYTAFFISINPLPSRFVNIDYMLAALEMKRSAPMSAIAVLSLSGYGVLFSFYLFTGFAYSFMLSKMENKTFLYYVLVGLFLLFSLFSIQYNLRGLGRFFYYSVCIFIIYKLFKNLRIKKRSRC